MKSTFVLRPSQRVPVRGAFDVAVVGGGIAGVAAAVSAARAGAKVCLIEKEHALGGLATLGLVVYYLPLCDGRGRQVIGGLGEELLKASIKYGPGEVPLPWRRKKATRAERARQRYRLRFWPASFMLALDELIVRSGVKLFFDTRFCGVRRGGGRVESLFIENKDGPGAVRAKTVVDASGDADVCVAAGEVTVARTDNRRSGWYFAFDRGEVKLIAQHDPLYGKPRRGMPLFAGHVADSVTALDLAGRRMVLDHYLKMRGKRDRRKVYPLVIPTFPEFRMTRRLRGAFELDEAHVHRPFEDAIGMSGDWRKAGPVYQIPLRCLAARRNDNLLVAGRCISTTDAAWDWARAIPTCAVTGEAAGAAAALAARRVDRLSSLATAELQRHLACRGVLLDVP